MKQSKHQETATARKILIIIVVLTSAISFALGYFVGNAGVEKKQARQQVNAELPQQIQSPAQEQTTVNKEELIVSTTVQPAVREGKLNPKTSSSQIVPVKKQEAAPAKGKKSGADKNKEGKKEAAKVAAYTVQAGAFKNSKDAETLKHKLGKNGYKAYIKKDGTAKDGKLFKVRIGEFGDKKDAEELAGKLKSTGLNAFVAYRDEGSRNYKNPSPVKQEKPR